MERLSSEKLVGENESERDIRSVESDSAAGGILQVAGGG